MHIIAPPLQGVGTDQLAATPSHGVVDSELTQAVDAELMQARYASSLAMETGAWALCGGKPRSRSRRPTEPECFVRAVPE